MFKQLSKKIQSIDRKWAIGVALGLALTTGAAYYFLTKTPKTTKTTKTEQKKVRVTSKSSRLPPRPQEDTEESPEKCLIRVLNKIKKTFGEQGEIRFDTVKAIYLGQYELSQKQFSELVLKYRSERRKVILDINRYRQVTKGFEQQLDQLHNRHLNSILAHFRIDKEGWMEVVEEVNANNKEEWQTLLNDAETEEISSLRNKDKPRVHKDVLINIYKFKAKYLREKFETYKALADLDPADLHSLIEKQLEDKVHDQFKVEEEDIKFSEKQLSQEQREQLQRYEEEYLDILRSLILKMDDDEGDEQEA